MSRKEKLFIKIKNGSKTVRIVELCKLMEHYGFKIDKSKEGYFFKHELLKNITLLRVPKPHRENSETYVKKPYVDKCIKAIEMLIELEQ